MPTQILLFCRRTIATVVLIGALATAGTAAAQMSNPMSEPNGMHYLFSADMPPGAVGAARLQRRGAVQGYYQPVAFSGPEGVRFAIAEAGSFEPEGQTDLRAGLLVGAVYRIKVTSIPDAPGAELFPTVEIIDRTYPPPGQAARFPIRLALETDDLEDALRGRLVTRVIYLEDPQTALPIAQQPDTSRAIDIGSDQDPLRTADRFGRPVAIIRIGSMTAPSAEQLLPQFFFGSPPWYRMSQPRTEAIVPEGQTAAIRTPHIPRDDVSQPLMPPYGTPGQSAPRIANPTPASPASQTIPSDRSWLR